MQHTHTSVLVAALTSFLCGCQTVPRISYVKIDSADKASGVTDSFYLAQSRITIERTVKDNAGAETPTPPKPKAPAKPAAKPGAKAAAGAAEANEGVKEPAKPPEAEYAVTSKPEPAAVNYKIGVKPEDSVLQTTKVSITKQDNTDLVSAIGVETTDNTAKAINDIGGVAVKILGLVAMAAPAPGGPAQCAAEDFPMRISVTPNALAPGQTSMSSSNGCVTLEVAAAPPDAIAVDKLPFGTATSNYYYSACRDAVVTFTTKGEKPVRKEIRIADPSLLQFVQLPYKGSVTMHSQCGVSVKTDATAPQNTVSIIDALATQGKAIKDALDANNKKK